jgi:uncharacterized protein YqjF (DUF2071 family)
VIDRVSPTFRPLGWPIGYQSWHTLLFLHWPVPEAALRSLVPARFSIDLYEGVAYVGLVPFVVEAGRPVGLPASVGLAFLETNVRTYVHLDGQDPGVFFFSLEAGSIAAVLGARAAFGLPYFPARGRLRRRGDEVRYEIQRRFPDRPALSVRYQIGEALGPTAPGTLEHFLFERYFLYVRRATGHWRAQVHHRPYPVQCARVLELDDQLVVAAGLPPPVGVPLAHFASRVDVDIFAPRRIADSGPEPSASFARGRSERV